MAAALRPFGTTAAGRAVETIDLAAGDLAVTVLTYGAILQDVRLRGVAHSLTLGSSRLVDYETTMPFHGAIVGPVANRISGARAEIGARVCRFEANEGIHLLHSGAAGLHRKVWEVAETGPQRAVLAVALPDGEGGFPGARQVRAIFEVEAPATLRLTLTATSDAPTWMNLANHSYWCLDGPGGWAGQRLWVDAGSYLPVDGAVIPTGEVAPVDETAFDFRNARAVAPGEPALDTCFCLAESRRALMPVAALEGRRGVRLEMATTEPGLQVFDGRPLYRGLALEAQGWPDAPNQSGFPSVVLEPGEIYRQITEWRFSAT